MFVRDPNIEGLFTDCITLIVNFQLSVIFQPISSYNDVLYNALKVIARLKMEKKERKKKGFGDRTIIHALFIPVLVLVFL